MSLTGFNTSLLITDVARVLTGVVLLAASFTKWMNLRWFADILGKYGLTPVRTKYIVAVGLACLESAVGFLLLLGRYLPASAFAALGLFLVFSAAVAWNLAQGRWNIECGCGGPARKAKIGWSLIMRNAGFVGLALISSKIGSIIPTYPLIFPISIALILIPYFPSR